MRGMSVRAGIVAAVTSAALFVARPPLYSSGAAQGRVILVVWDGAQRNHVQAMLDGHYLPNLEAMIGDGGLWRGDMVIYTSHCRPTGDGDSYRTQTGPALAALSSGYGFPASGTYSMREYAPMPAGYSLFERLEAFDPQIATGVISGNPLPPFPEIVLANARSSIDDWWTADDRRGQQTTSAALGFLEAHATSPFFLLVHYAAPDKQGHASGENSPEYSTGLAWDDAALGQIRAELVRLGIGADTVILVTTDHGFVEGTRLHRDCVPDTKGVWIASSQAWAIGNMQAGARQTSVGPTIFDLFGMDKNVAPPFAAESLAVP